MYAEYINYGASTVEILDEYIASKEQYLKILDKFSVTDINLLQYDIQFVLSNKIPIDQEIIETNITMTEFKKIYNRPLLLPMIGEYLEFMKKDNLKRNHIPKISLPVYDFLLMFKRHFEKNKNNLEFGKLIKFDYPISINAQSSKNRTGYGNEYFYDQLIYEGTLYGETSEFPIVGYIVNKDILYDKAVASLNQHK